MSDEKGLRFETGLIVILVMFVLAFGGAMAFHGIDARLDRIERALFDGAPPTAGGPLHDQGSQ